MTALTALSVAAGFALWTFISVLIVCFAVSAIVWVVVRLVRGGRKKR